MLCENRCCKKVIFWYIWLCRWCMYSVHKLQVEKYTHIKFQFNTTVSQNMLIHNMCFLQIKHKLNLDNYREPKYKEHPCYHVIFWQCELVVQTASAGTAEKQLHQESSSWWQLVAHNTDTVSEKLAFSCLAWLLHWTELTGPHWVTSRGSSSTYLKSTQPSVLHLHLPEVYLDLDWPRPSLKGM